MSNFKDVKKDVKKRCKKTDFYMSIIDEIALGKHPSNIAKRLKISRQKLNYYIKTLKKKKLIYKKGYGVWELNKSPEDVKKDVKKSSLGTSQKPTTNLHALRINFPIVSGKIRDMDWQIKEKLKNWLPKYKKLYSLGGLNLKNNNNKSVDVFVKARDIENLEEIDNLVFKVRVYIFEYFKKEGVFLDVLNARVSNINIATADKEAESMIRKGEKLELDLLKQAEKILPKDNIHAKAWIDGSPFKFTAETNDKDWKREYLSMPFRIRDTLTILNSMAYNLAYVAENYKSHAEMVEQGFKVFKKINKVLKQKKLDKWM